MIAAYSVSSRVAKFRSVATGRLAARQFETFTAMPGDNGLSPTLKAVPSCDIS